MVEKGGPLLFKCFHILTYGLKGAKDDPCTAVLI